MNIWTKKWPYGCAYNKKSQPIDADSLAHALLLIQTVNQKTPPEAIEMLLKFQQSDGGFSTFSSDGIHTSHSWSSSHPDVTAMVIRALLHVRGHQELQTGWIVLAVYMEKNRLDNNTWRLFLVESALVYSDRLGLRLENDYGRKII